MQPIKRIHHLSATVGDPNENLHFYRDILGLRLVKQTVNFEDNGTYHLYFANQQAENGTIMTFFPRTDNLIGRTGAGQVRRIAFSIPNNSLERWKNHLTSQQIEFSSGKLFGEKSLHLNDVHGLHLALVETNVRTTTKNILGFYGVELLTESPDQTFHLLKDEMGLNFIRMTNEYYVLEMSGNEKHQILINREITKRGRLGIGTVHHIAWSIENENELSKWQTHFANHFKVTDIKDRKYFRSAYFKDPGHIIYELATEDPGFTVDERPKELGKRLMLPDKYEKQRAEIIDSLPKLDL